MDLTGMNRWYGHGDKLVIANETTAFVLAGWPRVKAWRRRYGLEWTQYRPTEPVLRIVAAEAKPQAVERGLRCFERSRKAEPDRLGGALLREALGEVLASAREIEDPSSHPLSSERLLRQRAGRMKRREAAAQFLASFPRDVRVPVARLPERHWHVLSLLARCPGAEELFETNPALAFALASSWVFRERPVARPLRSARALLSKKRTAIAEWLGFPGTPAAIRVLGKVVPRTVCVRRLLFLRAALRAGPVPKSLLHLPVLDEGVLRVATDERLLRLANHSLLRDIAEKEPHSTRPAYLLADSAEMFTNLHGRALPVQQSLAGLERMHDELVYELNRRPRLQAESLPNALELELPAPPVVGTQGIEPLTTPAAILDEGQTMHHCVFAQVFSVHNGTQYVYRVLEPERATLSLLKRGGTWTLGELRGPCNSTVGHETRAAVIRWFDTHANADVDTWCPRPMEPLDEIPF